MSNDQNEAPKWLTSDYLEGMLKDFFHGDDLRLKNYKLSPASAFGDGYLGQLFRIEVNYTRNGNDETRSVIYKSLLETKMTEEMNKDVDVFKVETTMLSETLPLLHKELSAKGEVERFFPFLYKSDESKNTIFMEDLKADGYVMGSRVSSLDLDHVLLVTKILARMHSSSYLLFKKNPTHKDNYLDFMYRKADESNFMEKLTKKAVQNITKSLDVWPLSEEDKVFYRKFFEEKLWDLGTDYYVRKDTNFNVLLHGDCWSNNFMFKYQNGKPHSVKLIDFQISNYNSFTIDVSDLLFISAQEYVKLNHIDDVLQTYYDTFIGITGNIEGFTLDFVREKFYDTLKFGFFMTIIFRPGMLEEEIYDLNAEIQGGETEGNDRIYKNPKYFSEVINLLPLFKKHGVFK